MNEETALLQAILDTPEDTNLRLIYADWLDERGDPRGEFLRLLHQRAKATTRLLQLLPDLDPEWVERVSDGWALYRQRLPAPTIISRVETGAVQFGDDWPGLFLRGDNALALLSYIQSLCALLANHPDPVVADRLDQLKGWSDRIDQEVRA